MTRAPGCTDAVDRAHLTGASAPSPPIHRYGAAPALVTIARRHWIPVWHFPDQRTHTQKVLQYPVCLIVVAADHARLYGVRTGLSTVALSGNGWAVSPARWGSASGRHPDADPTRPPDGGP